ncbi:MAG TPA: hypothetical protein VEK07_16110 [Polyangiaceae bacterium]|nr:hypothetical protein [Polyangiaceae bacterium]
MLSRIRAHLPQLIRATAALAVLGADGADLRFVWRRLWERTGLARGIELRKQRWMARVGAPLMAKCEPNV